MSPEVRGMHTESGLLEKLKDGVEMSFAEEQIITYLSKIHFSR